MAQFYHFSIILTHSQWLKKILKFDSMKWLNGSILIANKDLTSPFHLEINKQNALMDVPFTHGPMTDMTNISQYSSRSAFISNSSISNSTEILVTVNNYIQFKMKFQNKKNKKW